MGRIQTYELKEMLEQRGHEEFLTEEEVEALVRFIQRTYEMPTSEEQEVHEITERLYPAIWRRATRRFLT